MTKDSDIVSVQKDYGQFAIYSDCVFEEYHVYVDGELKYIIGLYQDGDIWSPDEIFGTYVVDVNKQDISGDYLCHMLNFFIGDAVLHVKCSYILNDDFEEDCMMRIDESRIERRLI